MTDIDPGVLTSQLDELRLPTIKAIWPQFTTRADTEEWPGRCSVRSTRQKPCRSMEIQTGCLWRDAYTPSIFGKLEASCYYKYHDKDKHSN